MKVVRHQAPSALECMKFGNRPLSLYLWTLKSEVVGNMSGTLYRLMSRVERGTSMHQCRSLYMFNAAAFRTFFGPITMPGASVGGALVGIIDKFALC